VTRRGSRVLLLATSLSAVLAACTTVRPYYDYASEPDPRKQEFTLGPADVLRITVWKNADLSVDAVVRPDGTISLPLLGELAAAGRTPRELQAEIAKKLTAFVKDESATVTVAVSTVNSYRFVVAGNVEHGGSFVVNHYVTVTEAMTMAGGPNRFAEPEEMVIIRPDPKRGAPKRIPIDYPAILNGSRPDENLALFAGDTVYVP
jgi:polysaccharide biosynthesis/export protein